MHRAILTLAVAAIFLFHAQAAPRGGGFGLMAKVPSGSEESPGTYDLDKKMTFPAGQRACVIVTGRGPDAPPTNLTLLILDEKGQIIASDQGTYNLVAVWYPKRDAVCTIRILNPDSHIHNAFVSVK